MLTEKTKKIVRSILLVLLGVVSLLSALMVLNFYVFPFLGERAGFEILGWQPRDYYFLEGLLCGAAGIMALLGGGAAMSQHPWSMPDDLRNRWKDVWVERSFVKAAVVFLITGLILLLLWVRNDL